MVSKKPDKRKPYWRRTTPTSRSPTARSSRRRTHASDHATTRLLLRASCASERDRWVAGLRSARNVSQVTRTRKATLRAACERATGSFLYRSFVFESMDREVPRSPIPGTI